MKKEIPFIFWFVLFGAIFAVLAPYLFPLDLLQTCPSKAAFPPSFENLLGTDEVGRDIFTRIMHGMSISLIIGLSATVFAALFGALLGLIGGYYGGKTDLIIGFLVDISLAFPSLLLAIALSIILPPGIFSVILALSLTGWASFTRLIRGEILVLKNKEFVLAAKSLGSSSGKIIFCHLVPNCLHLLIVSISMKMGSFMLAESGLSFLGLGVPPRYPTLGGMIASGRDYLFTAPWISLIPGATIALMVLVCNFFGEKLQEYLHPKSEMKK